MNSYQEDGSAAGNPTPKDPPAVPDHRTGRPGGSGAEPPLHLIHMVKVGCFSGLLTSLM